MHAAFDDAVFARAQRGDALGTVFRKYQTMALDPHALAHHGVLIDRQDLVVGGFDLVETCLELREVDLFCLFAARAFLQACKFSLVIHPCGAQSFGEVLFSRLRDIALLHFQLGFKDRAIFFRLLQPLLTLARDNK